MLKLGNTAPILKKIHLIQSHIQTFEFGITKFSNNNNICRTICFRNENIPKALRN